jgi:phosphonate transport system substrate-binding protein
MAVLHRLYFTVLVMLALVAACKPTEPTKKIDGTKSDPKKTDRTQNTSGLHIAVGDMITPKEGYAYYLLDYISRKSGEPVHNVNVLNYDDLNQQLKSGKLDAAFVCSGPYVDGKQDFGLELLAVPRVDGKNVYFAYIIVPVGSTAKTFDDLKGKRFAFTDPLSNTGKLVPEYFLSRKGTTSDKFFSKTIFSGSHDKSIDAVATGSVDGASVDSLIWDFTTLTKPHLTGNTRIIMKLGPYPIPPFVVSPNLDFARKEKLRGILLNAHTNSEGMAILDKMKIERFETIDDKAYDSIREMKRVTGQK